MTGLGVTSTEAVKAAASGEGSNLSWAIPALNGAQW